MPRTKFDQSKENRVKDALLYLEEHPEAPIATVAKDFGIPRSILRSRRNGHAPPEQQPSFNTKLTYYEEKALCRYIDRLDAINLNVRKEFVVDAANAILKERAGKHNPTPPTVGRRWVDRFLKRNGYSLVKQKVLEQNRQVAENPKVIWEWF